MTRFASIASLGLFALTAWAGIVASGGRGPDPSPEPPLPATCPRLTPAEAATLRHQAAAWGRGTSMAVSGRWMSHRMLSVPLAVSESHRRKRIATLKLLLEIVRRAEPETALGAAADATALEEDEIVALGCADMPAEEVDKAEANEFSSRHYMMKSIEKYIANALKGVPAGR